MTVVLAATDPVSGRTIIGADSCASNSINHSVVKNNKVFHPVGRKDVVIGCAGTFRLPNLLQYVPGIFPSEDELSTDEIDMSFMVNEFTPVIAALTEDFGEDDMWEMIVAVGTRIYLVQMDLAIIEASSTSEGIGIGGTVALGAFKALETFAKYTSLEDKIKHALSIACDAIKGCSPPFLLCEVEKSEPKPIANTRESKGYKVVRHKTEEEKPKKKRKKKTEETN